MKCFASYTKTTTLESYQIRYSFGTRKYKLEIGDNKKAIFEYPLFVRYYLLFHNNFNQIVIDFRYSSENICFPNEIEKEN